MNRWILKLCIGILLWPILPAAAQEQPATMRKVLMFAVDGASWNVLDPLIAEGVLPNFKRLKEEGSWGIVQVVEPWMSEIIWTSVATGKKSQKHGITDRLAPDPATGEYRSPTSRMRKTKALWNILSYRNRKVAVLNYLVTWPPEKINGVMVAGWLPDMAQLEYESDGYALPPFRLLCSPQEFDQFKRIPHPLFSDQLMKDFAPFWWQVEETDNFTAHLAAHLLKKETYDFFCLYLRGIDAVSHRFWAYVPSANPGVSQETFQRHQSVIRQYYIWVDGVIGQLRQLVPADTAVMVVSDHGFRAAPDKEIRFVGVAPLLAYCGINQMAGASGQANLQQEPADPYSFHKNIQITSAQPLVPAELKRMAHDAAAVLAEVAVRETGAHPFSQTTETTTGFVLHIPPQITMHPEHHLLIGAKEYQIKEFLLSFSEISSGGHSPEAVLLMSGPGLRRAHQITQANTYDITPTLLWYLGVAVGKDMDGRVLDDMFAHPSTVEYVPTYETIATEPLPAAERSSFEEKRLKEIMRSLGYLN